MVSEDSTTGSISTPESQRRAYARASAEWNRTHANFKEIFPELCVAPLPSSEAVESDSGVRPSAGTRPPFYNHT
jgi:hypothetical protein